MNSVIINKEDLRYNIEKIKEYVGKSEPNDNGEKVKIIAVVKANAFGIGIVEYTKFLIDNGIDFFAVSTIEEALQIRNAGIKAKLIVLSSTAIKEDVKTLVDNDIIITIGSKEAAQVADELGKELNKKIKAHLKIDTGFGRYGFVYENREEIIKVLKSIDNIEIEGTFTHFSNAYYDDEYTKTQFDRFILCIEALKMNEIEPGMLHVCNTSAFVKFPNMYLNAVRVGSGFTGRMAITNSLGLKPIGYLKSNVAEIKELPIDFNVGYSNIYKTTKPTKVAIVPCGYSNGFNVKAGNDMLRTVDKFRDMFGNFKRLFSKEELTVEINGQRCPVIGRVGTFHITVDITDKNVNIGDEVIMTKSIKFVDSSIRREWK